MESTTARGSTLFQLSVAPPDDEAGNDSEEVGVPLLCIPCFDCTVSPWDMNVWCT